MSSRALRKIQREQEQQKQLQENENASEDETSEDEQPVTSKALNAFDILNQYDDEGESEAPEEHDADPTDARNTGQAGENENQTLAVNSSKPSPKHKKKKKSKNKGKEHNQSEGTPTSKGYAKDSANLDEIDLALKSLSTQPSSSHATTESLPLWVDYSEMHRVLAVDSKNLNATNEMKRLFGSVVLEGETEEPGQVRRRGRVQHLDLGGALAGRNTPVSRGQGLAGLALRRNVFIAGKEEWPKATSGGLGMEFVEKLNDGTLEYRFVHNSAYQDVQRQFEACVESLDPQRMIQLLRFNRWSSLLPWLSAC